MMCGPCLCGAVDCRACRGSAADVRTEDTSEELRERAEEEEAERIEISERPWLANSGYGLDRDGVWQRRISSTRHTARRDHTDGRVQKGDVYRVTKFRTIEDDSGKSWHWAQKHVANKHLPNG